MSSHNQDLKLMYSGNSRWFVRIAHHFNCIGTHTINKYNVSSFNTQIAMSSSDPCSSDNPRIFTKRDIEVITSEPNFVERLIEATADGFRILSKGGFQSAPIQTLGAYPLAPFRAIHTMTDTDDYSAQTCVKSGYMIDGDYYVIKVASGGNPFPNSGCMLLYSQDTGKLAAILMDDGILTELRTAAAGALAAKLLAPKHIRFIGIVGTEHDINCDT